MKRLVYSPYIQAFINSDQGVVDISPYLTSGTINRKVNQVSSAQLTLRNPVVGGTSQLLFTEGSPTGGPIFHPQDPIIITMQRLQGHPVQVFTGYLDKTPYLQLYPGLCSIEASCTLKRLLYTQWDAALPFVTYFLSQFGWFPNGDTGTSNNPSADGQHLNIDAGKIKSQFTDGSIGALLYAVLNQIGDWDSSTIWIESLPPEIVKEVVTLYHQIEQEVAPGEQLFEDLLKQILGTTSQGSGSPTATAGGNASGPVTNAAQIVQTVQPIATRYNVPLQLVLAVMFIETGFHNHDTPGNPHYGWFQAQTAHPPYAYGSWSQVAPTVDQAHDLGLAATAFCSAAAGWVNADPSLRNDLNTWAMKVQGVTGTNNPYYVTGWPDAISTANSYISQFGGGSGSAGAAGSAAGGTAGASATSPNTALENQSGAVSAQSGTSPGGASGTPGGSTQITRYQAVVQAANAISDQKYPYIWGGGHKQAGTPDGGGYDCSGSVAAVLSAAGYVKGGVGTDFDLVSQLQAANFIEPGLDTSPNGVNLFDNPGIHIFMQIGGHYFGTSDGGGSHSNKGMTGPSWLTVGADVNTFTPYHVVATTLTQTTDYKLNLAGSSTLPDGSTPGTGTNSAAAAAFSTMINLPSIFTSEEALMFTGKRSFMADQPLFPFVEQLAQASLRNFMSMPNGNFFAFFPDYFGLYGRKYYWEIHDIEIIDARIDLSDDPLVTHVAIAGDVTQYPTGTVDVFDLAQTAGIYTIFDAIAGTFLGKLLGTAPTGKTTHVTSKNGSATITPVAPNTKQQAIAFLQKYGARPYVEEAPMIRNPFFELFVAFQKFMLLWAKQFQTTIEVTFMPELFPGGLVALPEHHLQVYIEEVAHSFDYTQGFTTTVNISSPSKLDSDSRPLVSAGLARPRALKPTTPTVAQEAAQGNQEPENQPGA